MLGKDYSIELGIDFSANYPLYSKGNNSSYPSNLLLNKALLTFIMMLYQL